MNIDHIQLLEPLGPMSQDKDGNVLTISFTGKEEPILLSILSPISYTLSNLSNNLNHLQPSTKYQIINNNKSRVFRSKDEKLPEMVQVPKLVKLTVHSKDQFGVLTRLDENDTYIINYLTEPIQEKSTLHFQPLTYTKDIIRQWSTSLPTEKKNSLTLSMKPPTDKSPVKLSSAKINEQDDTIEDPFDYFLDKYFENLYLLTTPLTFFTKSTFTRLRTLCADNLEYESILKQFVIDHETFDSRHLMSNNGLLNSTLLYEKENIYRKKFTQKSLNLIDFDIHSSTATETNKTLSNVLNNFKIRELHLQILLLLEMIHISNRDDEKYFKKPSTKNPMTKRSLVGRRKLTPTINGGAIANTASKPVRLTSNQILDVYIDKLCIWDVLMGTSSTDNSTPKFMSYIIVPYFNKKCPNSVKYILKKVKGPSFKSRSSSSSSKSSKSSNSTSLKRSASISSSSSTSSEAKRPSLSRSSSNIKLEDIQELKSSLSRSNSDLQNLKRTSSFNATNLSKRQVDISLPPIPAEPEPALKRNSSIFNRIGKKKNQSTTSTKPLSVPPQSFSQVEATPVKSVKYVNPLVEHTPKDSANVVMSSSPIEYSKTPLVVQTPAIVRSSVKKPGEPFNFNNPEEVKMLGSPVSKGVRRRLFAPTK